jgi:hypothetical protein
MLQAIGRRPSLDAWRGREPRDLGLMWVDMTAYVADVVSFYDALISAETYLGTASLPGSRRSLVGLLGYRPRPAVACEILLAAQADGVKTVNLPAGTAFRSSEFLDEHQAKQAPQVFELDARATLDPFLNRLQVAPVAESTVPESLDRLWAKPGTVRLKAGDPLVLECNGVLRPARVASVQPLTPQPGLRVLEIELAATVLLPPGVTYAQLRLLAPGLSVRPWQLGKLGADNTDAIQGTSLLLESQAAIRAGEILLFEKGAELRARRVVSSSTTQRILMASLSSKMTDKDNNVSTLASPDIRVGISSLTVDSALGWAASEVGQITIYWSLSEAARLVAPPKTSLQQGDALGLPDLMTAPRVTVNHVLLLDAHEEGLEVHGALDAANRRVLPDSSQALGKDLTPPVQLFGNVLKASRGETVRGELLGYGDASTAIQSFKLSKMPLTYLPAGNAEGFVSTLSVRVGGIRWQEVPTFYGCDPHAGLFIVRHTDEGETQVIFGGAARVPTGAPVTADYRFGAGAAAPPAGTVTQLAKPAVGLKGVRNVLPAYGGDDAESPGGLVTQAPRSALLLGRAVSLVDLEAAAAGVPGVKATRARWRWDAAGLRPAAVVQFIGDAQLLPTLRAKLRSLSEPDAPIAVQRCLPESARLSVQLILDPTHVPQTVKAAVLAALCDLPGGLLRAENLGPEGVVFLSRLVKAVMDVAGVLDIQSLFFNETAFQEMGRQPSANHHWDFGLAGTPAFGISLSTPGENGAWTETTSEEAL